MSGLGKQIPSGRPWGAAVATVFVYVLLGPLIGSFVFVVAENLVWDFVAIWSSGQSQLLGGEFYLHSHEVLFIILISYIVGFLPALGCGLVHATYSWKSGQLPFWLALALGLLNFLIAGVLQWFENTVMAIAMFFAFTVSIVSCRFASIRFWRTRS